MLEDPANSVMGIGRRTGQSANKTTSHNRSLCKQASMHNNNRFTTSWHYNNRSTLSKAQHTVKIQAYWPNNNLYSIWIA